MTLYRCQCGNIQLSTGEPNGGGVGGTDESEPGPDEATTSTRKSTNVKVVS